MQMGRPLRIGCTGRVEIAVLWSIIAMLRSMMVRDVFPISGTLRLSASGVVEAVQLNTLHPLACGVADGLAGLLRPAQVTVTTGVV
jgi:hypothetical protein